MEVGLSRGALRTKGSRFSKLEGRAWEPSQSGIVGIPLSLLLFGAQETLKASNALQEARLPADTTTNEH